MSRTADGAAGPCARACPWTGAASTIITTASASISTPAAPVRNVVLARSRLTMAVISVTPFPRSAPVSRTSTVGIGRQKIRRCPPPNVIGGFPPDAEVPRRGFSLEIIDFHLRTGRYLLPDDRYEGAVLFLETSEELPPAGYVYRVLMCMGERKLQRFPSGGTVTVDGQDQQIEVTY